MVDGWVMIVRSLIGVVDSTLQYLVTLSGSHTRYGRM